MKVVLITNIPTPYRIPVFNLLAEENEIDFHVFYMANNESNRSWELPEIKHNHTILSVDKTIEKTDGFNYVHLSTGVWKKLNELKPDIVITGGFNPPQMRGWFWSKIHGKKHIGMSDGWIKSEEGLTIVHRILRQIIYGQSEAFLGASKASLELFQHYGAPKERTFQTHLVCDNELFAAHNKPFAKRKFDLIFSGRLTNRKNPTFLVEVLKQIKLHKADISIAFLGDGPLKIELENSLQNIGENYELAGHIEQSKIPSYMGNSKIHVFPTLIEAWGVVVNEAAAAGTPTISSNFTAAANELILDQQSGWVLDLEPLSWANKILEILENETIWQELSLNASKLVSTYSFENASKGMFQACKKAME